MDKNLFSKTLFQKFVKIEGFGGILLLLATLLALLWANSSLGDSYSDLWNYKIGFKTEGFELYKPLILWVNDGFMTIFFFLIGLEIKREVSIGELNSLKKMAFPLFGALGGMVVPVAFFLILNQNPETLKGWGIPMATDIAFSLAILNVLGKKVPLSLKIFLTAFAIVDDLGAVVVIAFFYSGTVNLTMLIIALILLVFIYILSYKQYYSKFILISFGLVIWILFLKSGIHPTLAGVLLAFSVPIRQKINTPEFIENLVAITSTIKMSAISKKPILSKEQIQEIDDLQDWTSRYQSPLQHMEHSLHGWVAYLIIPIFALANAGVNLTSEVALDTQLVINIILGLVLGKSIGITAIILFVKKIKLINIPKDITLRHIIGTSFLAGIGFTMAIFVSNLAFESDPLYNLSAKMGILIGSVIAAIIGYLILRIKPNSAG
ncbi:sodium/proton antiporter (NhaA family) [Leeuwenhoekiella aestuarii]|uniref:Na(+)/H(+) antiporter NhaA n=1 Tax=Leeuwenhoekiella aestuarii TaxID=2249426 RepID=A0A4Q0NTQ5_9FLAO|nr:Na+/H+ antiporter NhaA [Leeuwenhoekiella aestuarii]RXG14276.1 sodium/proton antiporter (NhaA family) [Leeuwenhoekiella aestuarii]RXG19025.1 sodium/proton antiporter (NhaA family) [Leeuwenhoekiella aestuarii]